MQKLTDLYRLNFSNGRAEVKYLLKRILRIKPTDKERLINEYYFHLIKCNGILKEESGKYYTAEYPGWNMTVRIRKRPSSDLNVFGQIFSDQEYLPVVEAYKKNFNTQHPLNIIDAGSNIGLASVYLSQFFNDAKFICIEPDAANFDMMGFNMEANAVSNVHKIKGGIWSKNTHLRLVNDFRDKNDWAFRVEETTENTGLEAFSIPHLREKYGLQTIDILKIDVEGSEKELFSAGADTSFLAVTKCIAMEIHDEFNCREAIYALLAKEGFDFFNADELTIGINKNLIDKS